MQRRIGHVLDLEVVEVTSHQVRLELQRSEPQNRQLMPSPVGGSVGSVAVDLRIWCRREKVVGVEADHRADTRWSYCEIHNHTGIVSCEQLTWLIWISDLVVIFHVTLLQSQRVAADRRFLKAHCRSTPLAC